jgi:protein TonB
MTRTDVHYASPNAHLLLGEMPAPRQMAGSWREGTGVSIAAHAAVLCILLYAATHVTQVAQTVADVSRPLKVSLDRFGRGGGGTKALDPPRPAVIAATRPVQVAPAMNPADPPPIPDMHIPVVMAEATSMLPGALTALDTTSLGRGTGPGAGGGRGPGSGPGEGPGVGDGPLAGSGSDVVQPGTGVNSPQLTKEVRPSYTAGAMQAKLQGKVEMQAVVLPDGSVDPSRIRITRSLDATFGLDQQAILAVKQWRFKPGTRRGEPVAMWVDVELTFTLR